MNCDFRNADILAIKVWNDLRNTKLSFPLPIEEQIVGNHKGVFISNTDLLNVFVVELYR